MIAVDTSTWIAFFEGEPGEDTQLLDRALADRQVLMIPAVLTELLSDPKLPAEVAETLADLPVMETTNGYWKRAGELRASNGVLPAEPERGSNFRLSDRPGARLQPSDNGFSVIKVPLPLFTSTKGHFACLYPQHKSTGLSLPL